MRRHIPGSPNNLWLIGLVLVVAYLLGGCTRQEVELRFTTIEKESSTKASVLQRYTETQPSLIVISSSDEIPSLSPYLSSDARSELSSIDFGHSFVVAVFQGLKGALEYEARIEHIVYQGETVKILTQFVEPTPGQIGHAAETSPYHVVTVEKPQNLAGRELRFVLIANGQEVLSENHQLP